MVVAHLGLCAAHGRDQRVRAQRRHTLHPRFALPLVEFIMSTLNSAPQSAIQCYLLVSTGELRPLAALNIFCGLASIAWSLVNFELIDFRGRQVVATARPQGHTLALLCFRIGELTARTSALALAASVVETLPTLSQRCVPLAMKTTRAHLTWLWPRGCADLRWLVCTA